MAMKLTTEAVKMRFPGVSNMSTDELLQLIRQESSKLLLLVGGLTKCFKITEEKVLSSICKRFNSGLETLRFSTFLIFLQNIIETLITLGYKPETSASLKTLNATFWYFSNNGCLYTRQLSKTAKFYLTKNVGVNAHVKSQVPLLCISLKLESWNDSRKFQVTWKPVSVIWRLWTADCRLRTRGKMQTVCKMQTADWE